MKSVIMRVDGQYLESFDPNAHGVELYPTGYATFTADLTKAMRFSGPSEALNYIMQISEVCPTRPDGRPNRPLRAFTLEVCPLPKLAETGHLKTVNN